MRIVCYRKLSNLYVKGKKTIYLPIDSMKQLKKHVKTGVKGGVYVT